MTSVTGTKIAAYRSASRTEGAFCRSASLTSRTIPAYVLSSAVAVAMRSNAPPALTAPDRIGSPAARSTGRDSPVRADSSRTACVEATPSTGITAPCLTRSRSPGRTSSTGRSTRTLVLVAGHGSRRAVEESRQLPVRPTIRVGLERLTRGEHQRDHRAREVLLQGERAAHREQGDHVDAGLSPHEPLDDVAEQRDESEDGRHGPRDVRGVGQVQQPEGTAREDPQDRGREPHARQILLEVGHRHALESVARTWNVRATPSIAMSSS